MDFTLSNTVAAGYASDAGERSVTTPAAPNIIAIVVAANGGVDLKQTTKGQTMEQKLLEAIETLNERLASVEFILKVIANNTRQPGTLGIQYYFQTEAFKTVERTGTQS